MKRILPSYLIVSILFYQLKGDLSLYNLFQLNFLVDGVRDFWFIPAIIICYLLFPLLYQIANKVGYRNMMIISTLFVVGVTFMLNDYVPVYYKNIEIFLQRIPCFIIGIYWGHLSVSNSFKEFYIGSLFSIVLVPVCMSIHFVGSSRWAFLFMSIAFIQILLFLLGYIGNVWKVILHYLGKRSLQIYLTHVSLGLMISSFIPNRNYALSVYFLSALVMGEIVYRINKMLNNKIFV